MNGATALTQEIATEVLRSFFREKPLVFFGTGLSCALDQRFGMPALMQILLDRVPRAGLPESQRAEWEAVEGLLRRGVDLERALDSAADGDLLRRVAQITGDFVAEVDREYALKLADGAVTWPAMRLFQRLVETLPEGDRVLHVLTPNYDMLFEHACDFGGIPYTCGHFGGVSRKGDWKAVERALLSPERVRHGSRMKWVYRPRKHLRLYKVHGSLSYFFHRGTVIENHSWMWNPPDFAERVLITPGLSKYKEIQKFRQELLRSADEAIESTSHFLFLGYGFNDSHLEEYVRRKLTSQGCHGLVLTMRSNERIEALAGEAPNFWVVCGDEGSPEAGSRVFNRSYSGWLSLPGRRLWDVREFSDEILGG